MRSRRGGARGAASESAAIYEFRLAGRVEVGWSDWFDAPEVVAEEGETVLRLRIADQPALHGVLATLRNLGLTLVAVNRRACGEAPEPSGPELTASGRAEQGAEQ